MTTDHASITRALRKLYGEFPLEDLDRIAAQLVGGLDIAKGRGTDVRLIAVNLHKSKTPLGTALLAYRTWAGKTQQDVADHCDWNLNKVMRMESGEVGASRTDVTALLDFYGVTDPRIRAHIEKLALASSRYRRGSQR